MKKIVVVDIGISNILSIKNALEFCGAEVLVTNQKKIIDLGFTDKDIIDMKSVELLLEYKKWRKDTGQ